MKNIIVFIFLLISINVSAQNIPADDTTARPAITETGKPIGKIVEKIMNTDGGTVISEDGTLELIIPGGALLKKTNISIQSITNTLPNGNALAYRLEPSGIQFQQPIQIVFHYNPKESEDSAQLLMRIAMQDDKGQWYGLQKFTLDTIAKTISGNISHFSIWATYDNLKLRTLLGKYTLKVKSSATLGIYGVFMSQEEKDMRGLSKLKTMKPPQKVIWSVNWITKGNTEYGTLQKGEAIESDAKWNEYTAPDNVPNNNPVYIRAQLIGVSTEYTGITINNASINTKIFIVGDRYKVLIENSILAGAGTVLGKVFYWDVATFIVSMEEKETKLTDIKNYDDFFTYEGKCTEVKKHKGTGLINIIGIKNFRVTPAQPPLHPFAKVEIIFIPSKVDFSVLEFTCPDRKGGTVTMGSDFAMATIGGFQTMQALPISITFYVKEGEQILQGSIGKTGDNIYQKISVTQLKDK